jgi:hypothetical protein
MSGDMDAEVPVAGVHDERDLVRREHLRQPHASLRRLPTADGDVGRLRHQRNMSLPAAMMSRAPARCLPLARAPAQTASFGGSHHERCCGGESARLTIVTLSSRP